MAINMSYGLLTSKTNNYKIPEYNSGYVNNTFSESQILQLISDFNQELREATFSLNLINYDTEYLNEASVLVNIRETIKTIVDKVITAITTLVGRIIDALKHVYESLTKKQREIVYVDRIVKEYRVHDRMSLLAKALKDLPAQELEVASIVPTAELVTKGFPNTNAIGKNLVSMIGSSVKSYVSNYKAKNGTSDFDIEAEASEGLSSFVQSEKKRILDAIFGKYEYDSTNVMESAKGAAIKAFGNTEPYKQILTVALYSQACDNIENQNKEAIDPVKFELKSVEENYSKTVKSLEQFKKDFIKSTSNYTVNNYGDPVKTHNDIRTAFANATDAVVRNLNTIINTINQCINANIVIIAHKIKRIDQVYSVTGDANKIRQYAHRLINNSLGTADQGVNEAYSVEPEEDEFINEQEIFDRQLVMLEECWMEHEFNSYIEQVILEADNANGGNAQQGNATQAATTTQTTTNTTQQTQQQNTNNTQQKTTTSKPNDNNSVMRLINKIIENMVTMYEKFKNRVDTLIIKTDSSFWNVNRAKIRALDLSKCTVNDWYSYDFGVLKKSVILNNGNFDINSPDLVSDDAFQNAILNNINPTKPSVEKDTDPFTTKLANRYYISYIGKDDNEVALGSMGSKGYNHQQAFTFADNMVRNGFNDEYLKSIDTDTKTLKKIQETIKQNKPVLTDQANDAKADAKAATTTGTPQNAAAIMTGKFNLAEMFALPQKKYSGELPFININEDVTVPDELQQGSDVIKDGAKDRNRATNETDARINRYFRYTSMAITSRMTVLIKAYKQYMELYKAVFNPSKKNTPDNKNQQQQQNNNQENK